MKKSHWKITILICVILGLFFAIGTIFTIFKTTDNGVVDVVDEIREILPSVFINNILLNEDQNNLILLENDDMFFVIEKIDPINTSISLNGSLNVLFDDFYGETIIEGDKIIFIPDFSISPGSHILEIKKLETNDIIGSYKFVIIFRESFDIALDNNLSWIIPDETVKKWFEIYDHKLRVTPKEGVGHASISYLRKLEGNFSVDLEIIPRGDNVSTVLYLIGPSRYNFVLGSNSDRFNFLFFTYPDDIGEIQGKDFLFQVGVGYHVRLVKKDSIISLLARELKKGDVIDYNHPEDQFVTLLEHTEFGEGFTMRDMVYNFGISVWQNSKGVEIGNIYIVNHGFKK